MKLKRRDFLKSTAIAIAGIPFAPSFDLVDDDNKKQATNQNDGISLSSFHYPTIDHIDFGFVNDFSIADKKSNIFIMFSVPELLYPSYSDPTHYFKITGRVDNIRGFDIPVSLQGKRVNFTLWQGAIISEKVDLTKNSTLVTIKLYADKEKLPENCFGYFEFDHN